jgi:hypothetical protein
MYEYFPKKKMLVLGLGMAMALSFYSCDYLDVMPDNVPTVEHAFQTRRQAEAYLYGVFSHLPNFPHQNANPAFLSGDETWFLYPAGYRESECWWIAQGLQNVNDPYGDYWRGVRGFKPLFRGLRDCNIFLENVGIPYDMDEETQRRWTAEAKFLKAYFHFWLFRMYGPIPLIRENTPISAEGDEVYFFREPVEDVVAYIVQLLDEAMPDLPTVIADQGNEMGRPTQIMALALKAQTLTYAASPLFNGTADQAPAFSLVDKRNVQLFPQTYDPDKWQLAADALLEVITLARDNNCRLYNFRTDNATLAGTLSEETIGSMQVRGACTEKWNPEIIWGDPSNSTVTIQGLCLPRFTAAMTDARVRTSFAPTLRAVEQFYTKNGVPIEEDKDWASIDPYSLRKATDADKFRIKPNANTLQLHFDRESRFYSSIIFDNARFFGNGRIADSNMPYVDLKYGNPSTINPEGRSTTGYSCNKLIHYRSAAPDFSTSSAMTFEEYPFPIIRLADLYLMYAEVLNEVNGPGNEVYEYIDMVRERSGLEGVVDSWSKYAKPEFQSKPTTKEGLREIIHRERMNELAFEGARFWDLRRWMRAEEFMNGKNIRGLNILGTTDANFYQVVNIFTQTFEKKDYFWPIPMAAMTRNLNLVQNPGWH